MAKAGRVVSCATNPNFRDANGDGQASAGPGVNTVRIDDDWSVPHLHRRGGRGGAEVEQLLPVLHAPVQHLTTVGTDACAIA